MRNHKNIVLYIYFKKYDIYQFQKEDFLFF